MRTHRVGNQRGAALIEAAVTIPIILFICVGIFEFGRAFQIWQVLTNAAREGARVAVINGTSTDDVKSAAIKYAEVGGIRDCSKPGTSICIAAEHINVVRNEALTVGSGSKITISLPYSFMVLNPIANLVVKNSNTGKPLTMTALAVMRNEGA